MPGFTPAARGRRLTLLVAASMLGALVQLHAAPTARADTCTAGQHFPQCDPNDPAYKNAEGAPNGNTWNDEQWGFYSFIPRTAPIVQANSAEKATTDSASGMSVDRAWAAYGAGRDDVLVAYMEGGVNWRLDGNSAELRLRAYLNRGELPYPEDALGRTKVDLGRPGDPYDLNGDGVFNVDDYRDDPRILAALPGHRLLHASTAGGITAEDVIVAFGDCQIRSGRIVTCVKGRHWDNDGNGYANDISGWNFHRDTNDPQTDQSAYQHANDESGTAVAEADNHLAGVGLCPRCRLLSVKAGDEAIDRPDRVAEALVFAVDSHAKVIVANIAALGQTPELRAAFQYAYDHDVVVAWASNDFDSADHTEGMRIPHLWPGNSIVGVTSTRSSNQALGPFYAANPSFRSRSTLTSYGPHALFSVPNQDGSTSTGTPTQGGVAALVVSAGLDAGTPLTADEVKQVVRATITPLRGPVPPNVAPSLLTPFGVSSADPDPGLAPGQTFNIFYGYGRPNVYRAMRAVHNGDIPPSADIVSPDWYANVDPTRQSTMQVVADVSARRTPGAPFTYELQYGLGPQPLESEFHTFASGTATGGRRVTAALDLGRIPSSFWSGAYQTTADRSSIERYDVTIRVQVHDVKGRMGEDRRAVHVRHDSSERPGFPLHLGTSGESEPTMADIEGRGFLDMVLATADGTVHAIRPDGTEAPGFPVHTGPAPGMDPASDVNYLGVPAWRDRVVPRPRDGISSVTAVGDLFHTGALDIVAATLSGRVYAWDGRGRLLHNFPVETDRAFAHQAVPVPDTPYVRNASTGSVAAPVLADLEGTGRLDIVQAAWDGRVYAWRPDGSAVPGWPVQTENPNKPAGQQYARDFKVASTPAIADVDGDGVPDVIVPLQDTSWPCVQGGGSPGGGGGAGAPICAYVTAFHGQGTRFGGPGANPRDPALIAGWPLQLQGVEQGYGSAQDFITEGVTSPLVVDLPSGPAMIISVELGLTPYLVPLRHPQDRSVLGSVQLATTVPPAGPLAYFTTSPSAGRLIPGAPPQVFLSGSAGLDIVGGVVAAPGLGIHVRSGIAAWDVSSGTAGVPLQQYANPIQGLGFITAPAVADVTGDGVPDIIETADSGALMAFDGVTGRPAQGFPKWSGGWGFYTPAVGDLQGTGTVAVAQMTREGDLQVWDTPGRTSADTEAWHWHQDDRNTGHHGTDTRPPAGIRGLSVRSAGGVDVLSFSAPGDDWNQGTAAAYQVFRSSGPISQDTVAGAQPVAVSTVPGVAGTVESITVPSAPGLTCYAVRAVDHAGNIGPLPYDAAPAAGVCATSSSGGSTGTSGGAVGLPNTSAQLPGPGLMPLAGLVALGIAGRRRRHRRPSGQPRRGRR